MKKWLIAGGTTGCVFLALDFTWLSIATPLLYRPALDPLLAAQPNFGAAAVFYALYLAGILILVVEPALAARSGRLAAFRGATLGIVAYGTYDLTNLATLRGWSVTLTVVDLAWGMAATAVAAMAGYWVSRLSGAAR